MEKRMIFADMEVTRQGKPVGQIHPAKFIYMKGAEQPSTEVAKYMNVRDDLYVIVGMVNPEDNSVSFFTTSNNQRLSKVDLGAGAEPWSIVLAPDSTTAYVANRAKATVVKVTGINTATPTVGTPVSVGSEPTGLALSPTAVAIGGSAQGRVAIDLPGAPPGTAISLSVEPAGLATVLPAVFPALMAKLVVLDRAMLRMMTQPAPSMS